MQAPHRGYPQRAAPILHEARDLPVIVSIGEADVHGLEVDWLALIRRQAIEPVECADPDAPSMILEQ